MNHPSTDAWLDFARGAVTLEQRTLMQSHLEDGCEQCLEVYETWRAVLEARRRESAYEPSANTLHSIKAEFASAKLWRLLPQIARRAQLVLDSSLQAAPAPVRSSITSARQLLLEAEPFAIHLQVQSEQIQKRTHLAGQVLNFNKPNEEMGDIGVLLLKGDSLIARTTTNTAGEFSLEFDYEQGLQLFVNIRGHKSIGIDLPSQQAS